MKNIQKIALGLCVFALSALVGASDWPNFRGANHDGISDEKLANKDWKAKPPKELWRIALGDDGYAGPSVAGGKLFIIDHKDTRDIVRAVDTKSGKDAWTFPYDDTDKSNYGFARATPTYDAGRVYTLSRLGLLHCLDVKDGSRIWMRDIKKDFGGRWRGENWDYAGSPLIDGDTLIVCPGGPGAAVAALDKNTGKDIWKGGGDDQAGYATPVKAEIGGKMQYVVFTGIGAMGVDVANGSRLWFQKWRTDYDVNAATPLVIGGKNVFLTTGYKTGCGMFDVTSDPPKELWRNKLLQAHFNSPILHEGFIYGIGDPGDLICINPADGSAKWRQSGFEKGGVVGIDGHIIALVGNDRDGKDGDAVLLKMSPDGYSEVSRCRPLGGQSWTAPIVAQGKLYVRNRVALVCLDLN